MLLSNLGALFRDVSYRNPHCAVCHGEPADSLICLNLAVMARSSFLDDFKPLSFAVLFDFDRGDGEEVGVVDPCRSGLEIWDPFFR